MLLTSRYVIPVSSAFDTYIEYGAVLVEGDRIVEVGAATASAAMTFCSSRTFPGQ